MTKIKSHNYQLWLASINGDIEKMKKLLAAGMDVNTRLVDTSYTPLICASFRNQDQMVEFLLENGADTEIRTPDTWQTAISIASYNINIKMVKALLIKGADFDIIDRLNNSCLDFLESVYHEESFQSMIMEHAPKHIRLLVNEIGILPSLKEKYSDIIELSLMGIF